MAISKIKYLNRGIKTTLILGILTLAVTSYGQKKKQKKGKEIEPISTRLSEEKISELDHYFLEGEKYFILKDFQRSYTFFDRALEIDPYNAAANYKMAQILNETRELNKALTFAQKAKNLDDTNKFYYLELADIHTNLGDLDQAEKTYSELVEKVPGTENYLFDLAALQLYQKKYEDAILTYDLAQFHLGPMEEIFLQRQQIYLKQNKLDLAIREGKKLLEMFPNEPTYIMTLGRIMISNDKLADAETFITEQLKKGIEGDKLSILLAETYRQQGKIKEALLALKSTFSSPTVDVTSKIRTLAGYLTLLPNSDINQPLLDLAQTLVDTHPESYQALAMTGDLYYNVQRKDEAREYYLKAVKIDGSNFNIWQNILSLDMDLQDYQGAIDHSASALEIFPNQATLYYFNGTAYLIRKDYENAIKAFNLGKAYAARDDNMNSLFHGQLGDAYNSMGDHNKSDAAYEAALKAKPDNDHVLNNYSYFLSLRKKDLDKAFSMSSKLVAAYPNSATYLDTHAWVLYMMEDFEGAKKYLELAIEFEPTAIIIEHYGDVLFQLKNIDKAVSQWRKARELTDDPSSLDKKIADRKLYE